MTAVASDGGIEIGSRKRDVWVFMERREVQSFRVLLGGLR